MNDVLVTGASGFIGSNIAEFLTNEGIRVFTLQRTGSTSTPAAGIEPLSLAEISACPRQFDVVYHCAAAGVNPYERNAANLVAGNIELGLDLMRALRSADIGKLVNLGSCSQYARIERGSLMTEQHAQTTKSLYGQTKAVGEKMLLTLAAARDISFVGLRLFGVYGPHEAPGRLIPDLVRGLSRGERVKMTQGPQVRDFLHVNDVISAIRSSPPEGIYNVCSAIPVTVREVAETVASVLNVSPDLLGFGDLPDRPGEEAWIVGDNSKLIRCTDWSPQFAERAGIALYVEHLLKGAGDR